MATPLNLAKSENQHRQIFKLQEVREAAIKAWRLQKGTAAIATMAAGQIRAVAASDLEVMQNMAGKIKG
jgi:hypothetical protein